MAELGYFNAYGNIVRKDSVDYVVHLGDYIYKSADGVVGKDEHAIHPEHELFSLWLLCLYWTRMLCFWSPKLFGHWI